MKVSSRVELMQESPIRKLVPLSDKVKAKGKKVYHLNIGQPDIETPNTFLDAVKNFNKSIVAYSNSKGEKVLIDSLVKYYKENGMNFEYKDIFITQGGSEAIIFAILATCDCDDEILVPEPFYTNYNAFASITGTKIIPITTKAENGFHLPAKEEILALITDKTRAILLANPGNPTGTVYNEEEINMIADIALEKNLFIISDEVYKEFVYDGKVFKSFATIESVKDRVLVADSISKRYSCCGARIGSIACKNDQISKHLIKLAQSRLCVATIEQLAAAKLIDTPKSYMTDSYNEYLKRRDLVFDYLKKMDGVICEKPNGAFYVIAKLPIKNAEEFVIWLLEDYSLDNETVMLAPAEGFYSTKGLGKDEVRISYCLNTNDMNKAMHILEQGLIEYKKLKNYL